MTGELAYVWAPWCMECKAMEPHIDAVAAEFAGSTNLEKINLSESPELAAKLNVMATPTIIGRREGLELFRATGRQTPVELRQLFAAAAAGSSDVTIGRTDRLLRIGAGATLAIVGLLLGPAWPLVGAGGGVLAWGLATGTR